MASTQCSLLIIGVAGVVFGALVLLVTCRHSDRESFINALQPKLLSMAKATGLQFNLSTSSNYHAFVEASDRINLSNTVLTNADGVSFIPAMGTVPKPLTINTAFDLTTTTFPNEFTQIKQYLSPARNQQNCGSCWAFATVETLEGRINYLTKGKWRDYAAANGDPTKGWLSPQYIISCVRDTNERGCQGAGELQEVIRHLTETHRNGQGVFLAKDYPYVEDSNGEDNEGAVCNKPANKPRFNFVNYYAVSDPNASKDETGLKTQINRIKQELMDHGPIETSMYVFSTFMKIDSTTNTPDTPYSVDRMGKGKMVGGHAVMIVGWGTIPGKDHSDYKNQYWELRNSWGPSWGHKPGTSIDNGYWYWRMGDDLEGMKAGENIMIEYQCVAGQPDMKHPLIQAALGRGGVTTSISNISTRTWLYGGAGVVLVLIAAGLVWYYYNRHGRSIY
jgi:C1A family cysteine protease